MLFLIGSMSLFGSWFQKPVGFWGTDELANRYPPDFPKIIRPVDADYKKDSLQADDLYNAMWKFYNSKQWDLMLDSSPILFHLCERLLEQKFDPDVFEYWAAGYGCYGQAMVYLGEIREGSEILNEFFDIKKRVTGDNYSLAVEYYGEGHMAIGLFNDPDLALDYYRLGEAMARKCLKPEDPGLMNGLLNMARGYWLKGDYATAMGYYQQVLNFTGASTRYKAFTYTDIGNHFAEIGDHKNALKYYLLARPFEGTVEYAFNPELAIANAYLNLGKLEDCARQIQHCEQLFRSKEAKLRSNGRETDLFDTKSNYFFAKKDFAKAMEWRKASIAAAESNSGGKLSPITLELLQNLAQIYLAAGKLPEARETINELLFREAKQFKAADFSQNPEVTRFTRQPYHLLTLELKGRIFERQYTLSGNPEDLQNALSVYLLADSLVDYLRDAYRGLGSKNQLAGSSRPVYQQGIDCSFRLWKQTGEQSYLELAWRLAEKSKSIALLESLRETEAKQVSNLDTDDLFQEKKLKRDLNLYEKLVFDEQAKSQPNGARISSWNQRIVALKDTQDSLLAVFKDRYPEYYRLKYKRKIATIAEAQSKLSANTALLEYFMGDSVLFTFLVDKSTCRVFRQRIDSTFSDEVSSLRSLVHGFDPEVYRTREQKTTDFQRFTAVSYQLYNILLAEPLRQTQARKLLIIPDDVIGYIPFAALLERPSAPAAPVDYRNLSYLVRDYAVRLEYSATLLQDPKRSSDSGAYLGIAPSYTGDAIASRALPDSLRFTRAFGAQRGGEAPALQFNDKEIDLTKTICGGETCKGADASEAFFKKHAPDAGVLHLAMHALTNDIDPLYSTLLFSGLQADTTGENDGLLHAYELYNLRLNADLAVLSACNTGAGKVVRGEGIMSLARAFKFAGCPNVMMSLWSVNDLAGKDLVVGFFEKLHAGMGKASALQAAQIDFLDNTKSDKLMHPYYWATFILVGDDEKVGFETNQVWVWVLTGLVFGLFSWFVMRRRFY